MEYFLNLSKNVTKNTTYCTLTNMFGITKFGSVMNTL
jgi:hypothetical protein